MKILMSSGKARCVDCDTEYFNGTSWKRISDYTENELVLQYNSDGTANLIKPTEYIKNKTEYLWQFKNAKLNQCLSEDHNIYYITTRGNLFHKTFKEVIENHKRTSTGFTGRFITSFDYIGGKGIDLSDNEIKLMCAIICDSSFIRKTNKCFFNLKKDRKKIALRKLLKEMNYEWDEREFPSMPGYTRFLLRAPRIEKEFTNYWYGCNKKQLQIICDNVIQWDGYIPNEDKESYSFSTISEQTANFIQFVFTACGYRAGIKNDNRKGQKYKTNNKIYLRKSNCYEVNISKNVLVSIFNRKTNGKGEFFKKYKTLDDYSYCFTVPSGMLVLRRDKKIFITGNSGKDTFANFFMESVNANCIRYGFADSLKELAKDLYGWDGKKDTNGRQLLIDVGQIGRGFWGIEKISTETYNNMRLVHKLSSDRADLIQERFDIFKKYFTPSISFWVDAVYRKILLDTSTSTNTPLHFAVISDWRFQSEYHNFKLYFGLKNIITVRINRNVPQIDDISEKDLNNFKFDHIIQNTGSLEEFRRNVSAFSRIVF